MTLQPKISTHDSERQDDMVTAYRDSVETTKIAKATYVPRAEDGLCPRCQTQLGVYYDEATCWQCGYVDYSFKPASGRKKHWMESGTTYMVRYCGPEKGLKDIVMKVATARKVTSVTPVPDCPFCGLDMTLQGVSGSGGYRNNNESRFSCPQGHRIICEGARDGITGWK